MNNCDRSSRRSPAFLAVVVIGATLAAPTAPADAARGITVGFGDPAFGGHERDRALDGAVAAGSRMARLSADWSAIAPSRPLDPGSPADPAYRFGSLDASVRAASARGFEILLEVGRAPAWAEGPNRPSTSVARAGTWRPDPAAYGAFASAIARRYAGNFVVAPGEPPLPEISRYQAWNEPNLSTYLTPQGSSERPESAVIYRSLLSAFSTGVKSVDPANVVVTAGTAPYGGTAPGTGNPRAHPVSFVRELLCLNGPTPADAGCASRLNFDALAHHPINVRSPFLGADDPDDVTTPDLGRLGKLLRKAEKRGAVGPGRGRPVWVTEFWWESDPPDSTYGTPVRLQARFMQEALFLFWRQRVPIALAHQVEDAHVDPTAPGNSLQSGVFFADGRPKAALTAFRFPLVARTHGRRIEVWGRAPKHGKLEIRRRRGGRWATVARLRVESGEVFRARAPRTQGRVFRAEVGGERSLRYRARRGHKA